MEQASACGTREVPYPYSKMCESGAIFSLFFIFFREKFANTIIRIVTLQRNSEKPPGQARNPTTIRDFRRPRDEEALRNN